VTRKSKARRAKSFISNDDMRARSYGVLRALWPSLTDAECLEKVQGMSQAERETLGAQVMATIVAGAVKTV
jgi:hypothetical protein